MSTYSIKISKGNSLKAFIQANSETLFFKLESFREKGFKIERVKKTSREVVGWL